MIEMTCVIVYLHILGRGVEIRSERRAQREDQREVLITANEPGPQHGVTLETISSHLVFLRQLRGHVRHFSLLSLGCV